jgi:hypothetical protein
MSLIDLPGYRAISIGRVTSADSQVTNGVPLILRARAPARSTSVASDGQDGEWEMLFGRVFANALEPRFGPRALIAPELYQKS